MLYLVSCDDINWYYSIYTKSQLQQFLRVYLPKYKNTDSLQSAEKQIKKEYKIDVEIEPIQQTKNLFLLKDEQTFYICTKQHVIELLKDQLKEQKRDSYIKPKTLNQYLYECYKNGYKFVKITVENNEVKFYKADFENADKVNWIQIFDFDINWHRMLLRI